MSELKNIAPSGAMFDDPKLYTQPGGILAKRYGVVPFSVLDSRQGHWQLRKRDWIALGIKGEEGRIDTATGEGTQSNAFNTQELLKDLQAQKFYEKNNARCAGGGLSESQERLDEFRVRAAAPSGSCLPTNYVHTGNATGTSVFDPVLCECVYKWFAKPGGKILDPFAGESTKGIVAAFLGYQYMGVELRQAQIDTNKAQALLVQAKVYEKLNEEMPLPVWLQGDSGQLGAVLDEADPFSDGVDFIWTSPPYYDLEIYSKSEKDGSAFETYEKFMVWYKEIFQQAVARLKPNRFLAVKVGEIRDENGFYRNFVGDNIRIFTELGLHYYNEIILVTAVGSLPIRISFQFSKRRKVGKTHQNVLVFYKGESADDIPNELGVLAKEDIENAEMGK